MSLKKIPIGNFDRPVVLRTAADVGQVVRAQRQAQGLRQTDLAGIGNTGNRLIVDIEKGKPTAEESKRYPGATLITRRSKLIEISYTGIPMNGECQAFGTFAEASKAVQSTVKPKRTIVFV